MDRREISVRATINGQAVIAVADVERARDLGIDKTIVTDEGVFFYAPNGAPVELGEIDDDVYSAIVDKLVKQY